MTNDNETRAAIGALNGQQVDSRALTANEARPRENRPSGGGRSGGGGYGGRNRRYETALSAMRSPGQAGGDWPQFGYSFCPDGTWVGKHERRKVLTPRRFCQSRW